MNINEQPLSWFAISVADMDRAIGFYNTVFGLKLEKTDYQGQIMAFFPMADGQTGGALALDPEFAGKGGVMIYLNGGDDLSGCLERMTRAGGEIITPKTDIGQGWGFFAHFTDSEGNRMGVWSPN